MSVEIIGALIFLSLVSVCFFLLKKMFHSTKIALVDTGIIVLVALINGFIFR